MKSKIGARFVSEGQFGTIRFIGEVPPTKGEWLGVEWDDPSRGKHDGSHEGKRYFTTSHPKAGSFLREKKADLGISFMDALEERYGRIEDESAGVDTEEMFVVGKNQQTTVVQVVGAKKINTKQSQFDQLKAVALQTVPVYGVGDKCDVIGSTLPNVNEIEIIESLLPSWEEVAKITNQFKKLEILNLSNNRLQIPDNPKSLASCFQNVQTLFINRMNYTWDEVLVVTEMFPSLKILHACINNIRCVTRVTDTLKGLKMLNLETNPVSGWEDLIPLGQLTQLQELILNDTGISEIYFKDAPPRGTTKMFPNLKKLSLSDNKMLEWKSMTELNKLSNLTDLRIRNNPLVQPTPSITTETIRYIIIASIKSLKVLNRSEILKDDRKGAEVDYLKMHGKEWKSCGGNQDANKNKPSQEFTDKHPRYQELVEKYGAPEDSELVPYSSALKNSLINILLDSPTLPDKPPIKKKLPVSMTVQKLKVLLQRLFKADPIYMEISYTSKKMLDQDIPMDTDMKEIGYFGVEDGDTIHVKW